MLDLMMMPQKTRAVFELLAKRVELKVYVLVGGTALSLQIGHRLSEDLDFCLFEDKLDSPALDFLIQEISKNHSVGLMTPASKITQAKINGIDLLAYSRDYLIDGVKVTFFARNDVPYAHFSQLETIHYDSITFSLMTSSAIFKMKAWLIQKRIKSRDLFDLMQLLIINSGTIESLFIASRDAEVAIYSEEFLKDALTGLIPVDSDDEGFDSIGLNISLEEVYTFFRRAIDEYEIGRAKALKSRK